VTLRVAREYRKDDVMRVAKQLLGKLAAVGERRAAKFCAF